MNIEEAITEYQCPGCVSGESVDLCDQYKLESNGYVRCVNHVCGTRMLTGAGFVSFALGLPKGFNRSGVLPDGEWLNRFLIRIWLDGKGPGWDRFNISAWAFEENGALFVRTYMPRINTGCTDVIVGGSREKLCPNAIDVSWFHKGMD